MIRLFENVNKITVSNKNILNEISNKVQTLNESKQTEQLSLKILSKREFDSPHNILEKLKSIDTSKNQVLLPFFSLMYDSKFDLSNHFRKMIELIKRNYLQKPELKGDVVIIAGKELTSKDTLKFTELIDHLYQKNIGNKENDDTNVSEMTTDKPIFDKNGIKIFDANDKSKCIVYTQGGLTSKKYSFCIGQYVHNMYQSYRDTQTSTFYFLVDENRDKSDPLHIVVVDHTSNGYLLTDADNNTGDISEYGDDVDGYFEYLETKGVDVENVFKHRPKDEKEEEEDILLGPKNWDLEWFKNLSYDHKSKYIGRGHSLTDEQFAYLWSDRKSAAFRKLLEDYLNTGIPLTSYQFKLLISSEKE